MLASPSGVHMVVTRIRFSVRVPVLSVQITEVDPRVSTALSRLTRAPRRAISRTPTASARVIVGSSPSGTLATSSPIAKLAAAATPSPAARPIGKNAIPAPTATNAISVVARLTWCSSGLSLCSARWLSAAIRPSSVPIPVAVTRASASPPVQAVPLNTTSAACSSGRLGSAGQAERVTGTDSPVSVDMSTSRVPVIRRASAQMLSPSSISRTSPGTSSRASITWRVPSRRTLACLGRNAASASTAFSACISCANANPAFSRITAAIATANRGVPLAQASTAATASSTASGWVNCAASSPGQRRPPRRASSFGPDTSSRRAASRPDRPSGAARKSRNSCASGSSGFAGPPEALGPAAPVGPLWAASAAASPWPSWVAAGPATRLLRRRSTMCSLLFSMLGRVRWGRSCSAVQLAAGYGDHLDAVLAQHRVGGDVALVPTMTPGARARALFPSSRCSRSAALMSSSVVSTVTSSTASAPARVSQKWREELQHDRDVLEPGHLPGAG